VARRTALAITQSRGMVIHPGHDLHLGAIGEERAGGSHPGCHTTPADNGAALLVVHSFPTGTAARWHGSGRDRTVRRAEGVPLKP
jgi:hypothetical protein